MQSSNFVFDKDVPKEDVDPGIKRQILSHSDDIMLVKASFETGAEGYMHEHYHSQIAYVESGVFDVTVDGETKRLKAGDSFLMTPHVMHGAICIEAGVLLDMFSPIREDFFENYYKGEKPAEKTS